MDEGEGVGGSSDVLRMMIRPGSPPVRLVSLALAPLTVSSK